MVTRRESAVLWEQVKENHRVLDSCDMHSFELIGPEEQSPFGRRYRCARCGGEVDSHACYWYNLGFQHGKAGT